MITSIGVNLDVNRDFNICSICFFLMRHSLNLEKNGNCTIHRSRRWIFLATKYNCNGKKTSIWHIENTWRLNKFSFTSENESLVQIVRGNCQDSILKGDSFNLVVKDFSHKFFFKAKTEIVLEKPATTIKEKNQFHLNISSKWQQNHWPRPISCWSGFIRVQLTKTLTNSKR